MSSVWADGFALRIDDVSGLDEPWPLIAGLPFPEGELHDSAQIRIIDASGAVVPAQVDVSATWRDGSIRWALAGFTASPQGAYRVEFDAEPSAVRPASVSQISGASASALRIEQRDDGVLLIDTGAASYEFLPDRLLPERAHMDGAMVLANSGDGAYLVDNQGRVARVAGKAAQVTTQIVKQGSARAVVRREGWYVTADGKRLARSLAWFYFAAGSPSLRVTHSLIFTEDTNTLWARDYGLEFRSPKAPSDVVFALSGANPSAEDLKSMRPVEVGQLFKTTPDAHEVFMLQDVFPHFLEREARGVVGSGYRFGSEPSGSDSSAHDSLPYQPLKEVPAVGDWADAGWKDHGLTVVMPWLAQRFPKEIAFGPNGARVAFWSGRSGRELDFRAATLVDEYWQRWADYSPEGRTALAAAPSNAQGAARTHDVWLLPHSAEDDQPTIAQRAKAASQPPLVLADPVWLTATEAIGWPMHPKDLARFPKEEAVLSAFWDRLIERYEGLRRTGFIAWGDAPHIRDPKSDFFRVSGQVDYGLRRHVWGLYARSGERQYFDYGARFNRFSGDWSLVHEDVGDKFSGGMTKTRVFSEFWDRPLYWGDSSALTPFGGNTGHDIVNWLLEYYLTGDEHAFELTRLHGDAFKAHWAQEARSRHRFDGIFMILRVLATLYAREWDETFGAMARELADYVIDLDSPNGINDGIRYGSLYKDDRNLISLYYYYRETGDERAREAFLRGVDYEYRFNRVNKAFNGQSYASFLFAVAYRWTGDPNYLRVLNTLVDDHRRWRGVATIYTQMNPTMGLPTALGVLAETKGAATELRVLSEAEGSATRYPVLRQYGAPQSSKILFRKPADRPVQMRIHLRLVGDLEEGAAIAAVLMPYSAGGGESAVGSLELQSEAMFGTRYESYRDPRRRFVSLTLPGHEPAGLYELKFPGAEYVDVLDTDAPEISVYAPEGYRMQGSDANEYFRVAEGTDTLRLFLDEPTEVRRPDGSVALTAGSGHLGEREIPVQGQAGVWSLNSSKSGIIRLLNAEGLFAREPQWLLTGFGVVLGAPLDLPRRLRVIGSTGT